MKKSPLLLSLLAAAQSPAAPKPVYSSHRLTSETVGHAVDIEVDVSGAKKLFLVVNDGGDGFACDWANWVNPVISGDFGTKKLTEMRPVSASADWGQVRMNQNAGGSPMVVNDQPVAEGIGTHAHSVIEFDLPVGSRKFTARGALDKGGVAQGNGATVQFQVYTEKPAMAKRGGGGGGGLDPEAALAALEVGDGLQVESYATEPMLLSPSAMDIDHKGRVWIAEVVNYRGHNGKRPSGDRILVLEDSDRDGKADKQTVFFESPEMMSPHGVTVLGNRVIVAAAGKVWNLYDENGDLKADKAEVMFSGIDGAQHDHSIHAAHFGPDGKLYFNFGNEGHQLKDKDGKPIMDVAGNEVRASRQPYQEGMIFRCNPDGSGLETVAWNFRNNWEVAVDSFGGIWQSDNDDDGNKGVRINFVMEFGNYGYRDEVTGAGWNKGNAKTDEEVQAAHWHLRDPGVVPNLLHTGAGSPTGILVYEGGLLPSRFHGQMIHADAGPNIVRAYPVTRSGAGYAATMDNLVGQKNDRWFRPSDVCVAPDGSLFIADWYDPGVGGHAMGDLDHGRVYRVTPAGHKGYAVPSFDFSTPEGAAQALANPNEDVRYLAWEALHKAGDAAVAALQPHLSGGDSRLRARALWVLGKLPGKGSEAVKAALADKDEDIRCLGLRLARQLRMDLPALVAGLVNDPSAAVRREAVIALRFEKAEAMAPLWAQLAKQHDGKDRWYLEALGIGAALQWDACLAAYLALVPQPETTAAGRAILWRSRAATSAEWIAKAVKHDGTPEEEKDLLMRAFDFQPAAAREKALESLLQ